LRPVRGVAVWYVGVTLTEGRSTDRTKLADRADLFAQVAAALAGLTGLVVLVGWIFSVQSLKGVAPGLPNMKANTAVSVVVLAVAAFIPKRRAVVTLCGAFATVVGTLTVLEYLTRRSLGIDQLLFADTRTAVQIHPGRPGLTTASYLLLLGVATILLAFRRTRIAHALAAIAFFGAVLGLLGYAYGVEGLYTVSVYTSMALHTVISIAMIALSVLATNADRGLTRLAVDPGAGGILVRRAVPSIWIGIIVIGWLRLLGQEHFLYGTDFGLAIMVVSSLALITGFIAAVARRLSAIDGRRRIAEDELRNLNTALEAKVAERTAELAETEARYRSVVEV